MQAKAMVIARSEVMGASGDGVVKDVVESGSFVSVEGDVDESVVPIISVVVGGCTGSSVSGSVAGVGSSVPGVSNPVVVSIPVAVVVVKIGGSVTSEVTVVGSQVVVVLTLGGKIMVVVVSPGTVVCMITVVVATGASAQSSV